MHKSSPLSAEHDGGELAAFGEGEVPLLECPPKYPLEYTIL